MLANETPKRGRPSIIVSNITNKWEAYREGIINGNNVTNTMLTALYNSQDKVMRITSGPTMVRDHGGVRWNKTTGYKTKRGRAGCTREEIMYEVEWSPSIICENHINSYRTNLNYKPKTITPLPDLDDMHLADHHIVTNLINIMGPGVTPPSLRKVTWEPRSEPLSNLTWQPSWENIFNTYSHQRATDEAEAARARTEIAMEPLDSHLSNSQRQGIWSESLNLDVNTLQRISELTVFGTQPLNPEFDIIPNNNNNYSIQVGMLTPWSQKSERKDTAFIHSPAGKCIGSLPIKRLATLMLLYKQSNKTYTKAAFAEATANLIMRYTDGYKHDTKHTTKWQNETCSPLNITECMTNYFGIRCERFASPLNADPSRPQYFSMYQEDSTYGAKHDAYSCPWTGISLANPEPDHHQMNKSVRWAISSALTHPHIATATILFLPAMKNSPYTECLTHPSVRLIAHVPAQRFKNTNPDYWTGGARHKISAKKQDMNIFVVCNDAGKNHIAARYDSDFRTAFKTYTGQTPKTLPRNWSNKIQHATMNEKSKETLKYPQKLMAMLQNPSNLSTEGITHTCHCCAKSKADTPNDHDHQMHSNSGALTILNEIIDEISSSTDYNPQPLAHNWTQGIYTDGCKTEETDPYTGRKTTLTGAACYDAYEALTPEGGKLYLINPNGQRETNTINRAELSAILQALIIRETTCGDLTIYTDSLCSIYMIQKALKKPILIRHNKHKPQLDCIANLIRTRCEQNLRTHIYKVKSHTGIHGNEAADQGANLAARDPSQAVLTDESDNNYFGNIFWPGKIDENSPDGAAPYLTSNLNSSVKHAVAKTAQTGYSNETLYGNLHEMTRPYVDKKTSNCMWSDKNTKFSQIRAVIKYRWGALWNARTAKRMGMTYGPWGCSQHGRSKHNANGTNTTEAPCPLCHHPDGGTHTLAGCQHPRMKAQYILRHDQAVAMILKTIKNGKNGGCYTIMDAGQAADLPEGVAGKRLPPWILPKVDNETRRKLRPDILIIEGLDSNTVPQENTNKYAKFINNIKHIKENTKIHIVEVGYTGDLAFIQKKEEKQEQHKDLVSLLRGEGWTIDEKTLARPIVLGVGGAMYKDTRACLLHLGVEPPRVEKIMRKLNMHATQAVSSILHARREEETAHRKPG